MLDLESVAHYVHGLGTDVSRAKGAASRPFVTISRQAGAGGRSLAETIVARMGEGWQVFDHQLCGKIAEDKKLKVSIRSLLSEEFHTELEDWYRTTISGTSSQHAVIKKTFETLRAVAALGRAVLVGRGGAFLTRDFPLGVHVRLVASKKARVERLAKREDLPLERAERRAERLDADRAKLIRTYFKRDIQDALQYHAVWNTDETSFGVIADVVVRLLREQARKRADLITG